MITSDKNQIIKEILKLKTKKERDKSNLFYIEGERLISEVPEYFCVEKVIFSAEFYDKNLENIKKYSYCENLLVSDEVFKKISDTLNPQGIMAICKKPQTSISIDKTTNNFFVVLDRITDPGNLGTIIRTAEAMGCNGIFLSNGCVDLYNPKVLRATMGAIFHIPIFEECELLSLFEEFKQKNIKITCTHLEGEKAPYDVDFTKSTAILIGNEANGILEEYKIKADFLVKIPMLGQVESLNASTSSAIILYEGLKQRMNTKS